MGMDVSKPTGISLRDLCKVASNNMEHHKNCGGNKDKCCERGKNET